MKQVTQLGGWTALALLAACSSSPRTIKIPESVMREQRDNKPSKSPYPPYVIKMSDGQRAWQIEIPAPQGTGAFEAKIPLDLGEVAARAPGEIQADHEIKRAAAPAGGPSGQPANTAAEGDAGAQSYLTTLARVNALFRKKQYELALIELVRLEQSYPDDERLLEMKGTLYWRLKKNKLAREAWERVLALNPDNTMVAQALDNLLGE